MLKNKIGTIITDVVNGLYSLTITSQDFSVDFPTAESHGDYTTNVAMVLRKFLPKEVKHSPLDIAKKIQDELLKRDNSEIFAKVEVAPPGFINLTLSLSYLHNFIVTPLEDQIHEMQDTYKDSAKFLIEYVSPNTNKPLHIGHLRNASLGHALINLSKSTGMNVFAANLNNDRGIHIIKSMYGYLMYARKTKDPISGQLPLYKEALSAWVSGPQNWLTPKEQNLKGDHFVGYYYILGHNDYEESEKQEQETGVVSVYAPHNQMQQMLQDWESNEPQIRKLWENNNNWYYQGMHQTLKDFNIYSPNDPSKFFDKEWYESEIYNSGKDVVMQKIGNGVITEFEDGHVEAVLEKYNLPNIVLLRKNKTSLYIIQDIELLRQRIKEYQMDKVLYLTAAEQNLRFQQLFAICESLGFGNINQMVHLGYGMVRTPEGKMSSRKGTVILADELIADVQQKAMEKINKERGEYTQSEKEKISMQVAIAAIKYGILKYNSLSNIIFDIESSISFEGDTGPYIQYTHARTASIIRKYIQHYQDTQTSSASFQSELLSSEELDVIKHLHKFPEIIVKAAHQYSPNYVCEYLFNLSQKFNYLYTTKPIIKEENAITRSNRVLITLKAKDTLKTGLELLGIEAPEKM